LEATINTINSSSSIILDLQVNIPRHRRKTIMAADLGERLGFLPRKTLINSSVV
jgi:hypothetical protein